MIFIILIFCLLTSLIFIYYNILTEEDSYHTKKEDGGIISLNATFEKELLLDKLKNNLNDFIKEYNNYNPNNKIINHHNYYIYDDINEYNQIKNNFHYKILLINKNKINIEFVHKYIGGAYIRSFLQSFLHIDQIPNSKFYPHSSIINFFMAIKLLFNYNSIPRIINNEYLPLIKDKSEIKRYVNRYCIERSKNKEIPSRIVIIYNVLKKIHTGLKLQRPLIIYFPVAFNHVKNVSNNIGLVWMELKYEDTIQSFNKRFDDNRYQALATNFILLHKLNKLIKYSGSNVRKNVDVVVTSTYYNNDSNTSLSWTYNDIAEYPIYVALSSCIVENKIYVTETITSNIGEIKI